MKCLNIIPFALCITLLSGCQVLDGLQSDIQDFSAGEYMPTTATEQGQSKQLLENPCPQVEIVDDLSSLSDFADPRKPQKEGLISRVDLKSAESACKLASKSVVVDLKLIFNGTLGAKGRVTSTDKPFFSYPYFIAVTAPNGKIMAKEIFAASMAYPPNENQHTYFENLRQIIPIQNKDMANRYKILIGFQVTPDQLSYNRKHMVPTKK